MNDLKPRIRNGFRDLITLVMIAIPILLLGGFAWMTNAPEAVVFDRLAALPVVGAPIDRLRDPYRPREPPPLVPAPFEGESEPENASVDTVFVGGGAIMRQSPADQAEELGRTTTILRLRLFERRDTWARVEWPAVGDVAWVDLEAKRRQTPPMGIEPDPAGPLPGRAADSSWLVLAEEILGSDLERGRLGPYELRHDLDSRSLLKRLDKTVSGIERAYRERFGVQPGDRARETIVVFREESDYLEFRNGLVQLAGVESSGHTSRGLIAFHAKDPDFRLVEQILIHEITHQLNRRALGPSLPAWLEEGLCEEFSELGYFVHQISNEPEWDEVRWIRSFRYTFGDQYRLTGAYSSLEEVARASLLGNLSTFGELVALDWKQFVGLSASDGSGSLHYAMSGWLVRYLLEGEEGGYRDDFLRYLATVAQGEPPSGKRLTETLGIAQADLDAGFRSYLLQIARDVGVPAVSLD